MIQRQQSHPIGTLPRCAGCHREPRHYLCNGRTNAECGTRVSAGTDRHVIECSRCDRRTARHADYTAALAEWKRLHASLAFLRDAPVTAIHHPRRIAG